MSYRIWPIMDLGPNLDAKILSSSVRLGRNPIWPCLMGCNLALLDGSYQETNDGYHVTATIRPKPPISK
jgi:hypothetical protein